MHRSAVLAHHKPLRSARRVSLYMMEHQPSYQSYSVANQQYLDNLQQKIHYIIILNNPVLFSNGIDLPPIDARQRMLRFSSSRVV